MRTWVLLLCCFVASSLRADICSNLDVRVELAAMSVDGLGVPTNNLFVPCGVPVVAIVTIRNIGPSPVTFSMNMHQYINRMFGLLPCVYENGKQLDSSNIIISDAPLMNHPVQIMPNEVEVDHFDLTTYFGGLGKPGTYEVQFRYQWSLNFYYDRLNGDRVQYENCMCIFPKAILTVESVDKRRMEIVNLNNLHDGNVADSFIIAAANASLNGCYIPSATEALKWGEYYAGRYFSMLRTLDGTKAKQIEQEVLDSAASSEKTRVNKVLDDVSLRLSESRD